MAAPRDRIGVSMTTDTVKRDATKRVGKIEMRVGRGKPTPESKDRWDQRVEVLSAWLLAEWRREQGEAA